LYISARISQCFYLYKNNKKNYADTNVYGVCCCAKTALYIEKQLEKLDAVRELVFEVPNQAVYSIFCIDIGKPINGYMRNALPIGLHIGEPGVVVGIKVDDVLI